MTIIKKLALVVVSLSLVAVSSVSSAKPFTPKKPVELIIPAGQGGGADEIARLVQGVIEKNDYASKPVIPINKKGGLIILFSRSSSSNRKFCGGRFLKLHLPHS